MVELLLHAHCDVTARAHVSSGHNVTALHFAAQQGHVGVVRQLLAAGAQVDAAMVTSSGVAGVTPLHLAVEMDRSDVIDALIQHGCDVSSCTQSRDVTVC